MLLLLREQCERLFPFSISLDEEMRILDLGRSLRRLMAADVSGRPFDEWFVIDRPVLEELSLKALLARKDSVVLLQVRDLDLRLRGEIVEVDGGALFVGTPWLTELGQVAAAGLVLRDFALHDPTTEMLVVMKTMQTAIADANILADKLRRQAQQLQAAEQLAEHLTAAKSSFIANMSLELRTPLNAIFGYSELMLDELGEATPEEMRDDLQRIQLAGQQLLRLVADVLDLSRIEAQRVELREDVFSLATLLRTVKGTVLPQLRRGVALVWPEDQDAALFGDSERVRQVLLNLLANACKFTELGEVGLAVSLKDDGVVEFVVHDTGIGIRAEQQRRVFEAFYQADSSLRKRFGGSGLGLALARGFVEAMGGTISVESEYEMGSRFTVRVPLGRNQGPRPRAGSKSAPHAMSTK
ncbi:HAMP domain-containing sensor histidine kinase [Nannocystis pusilla]|uniref:HAMP domain-containing sensor histidine kinase n=1 Tax=Nannocystis pusilla TaxID=889268 RepID=A0A9X3J268_9BACT|nr:HAMP domain-containing sensor histidine kinase [Nannocystis pusilla]MCY1010783.1 HAMP domain-containing sensor histidine kinase [Nannocystis pusilla]